MSKKILSLALAVVMLFSICAVAASAVQGDGTENIRIYMTSDAKVGAPAGTEVKVSYHVDLPDGIDELDMCIGNIAIGWNTAAYSYVSRTWGADFEQYMKSTAAVTTSAAISTNILKKANANDTAKGYNKAIQVQMLYDGTNSTSSTGIPVYDNQEIFTLAFTAEKELTASDVIGVVEGAYGQSFFKVCWFNGTTTAKVYPVEQVNMADAAVAPNAPEAPSYDVYSIGGKNGETAVKKANDNGTYNIGTFFAFKAATIAPEFDGNGTSANIKGITATITANLAAGGTSTVTAEPINFVYDVSAAQDKSELGFIVAIMNIPNDAAEVTSYTITPVMTTDDGNTYTCETITVNVADLA